MGATDTTARPRERDRPREGEGAVPLAEWVAAACGAVVMLATLACLAWLAVTERHGTVDPVVRVLSIERQGERHHLRLRVENQGTVAAADLRVQGQLRRGDTVVEEAEVEFDHLPAGAHRDAGMFFREDPRQDRLDLSVSSYRRP